MDALEAIARRYSERSYTSKPVPKDVLEKIVDAGRRAPTARNVQPWEFVVVTDAAARKQIAGLAENGKFIEQAPACVAVFCKDTKYYLEDGCNATTALMIAAAALGVQSCWVAGDKKPYGGAVAERLGLPDGYKLVSLVPLGYAAAAGRPPAKRPLDEVIHWEKF
ncbi:MAG TPA: nitroreductase family protein [Elusimicrobiota bacterium]|nr:nitroreductase family protein [Elusimicrobiota bacterium]